MAVMSLRTGHLPEGRYKKVRRVAHFFEGTFKLFPLFSSARP